MRRSNEFFYSMSSAKTWMGNCPPILYAPVVFKKNQSMRFSPITVYIFSCSSATATLHDALIRLHSVVTTIRFVVFSDSSQKFGESIHSVAWNQCSSLEWKTVTVAPSQLEQPRVSVYTHEAQPTGRRSPRTGGREGFVLMKIHSPVGGACQRA